MRKIIMLLATICVLVLTIEIFINGIGILNINGVNKISNKNKEIDAAKKNKVDEQQALEELIENYMRLMHKVNIGKCNIFCIIINSI